MRIRNLFDPGSGMEKFLSGINIPDPQHCLLLSRTFSEMVKAQTLSHGTLVKILLVVCATEYAKNTLSKFLLLITVKFFRITIVLDMHRKSWPTVGHHNYKRAKNYIYISLFYYKNY
jgi:hypothetical protein